jgi:hypothetical protein
LQSFINKMVFSLEHDIKVTKNHQNLLPTQSVLVAHTVLPKHYLFNVPLFFCKLFISYHHINDDIYYYIGFVLEWIISNHVNEQSCIARSNEILG